MYNYIGDNMNSEIDSDKKIKIIKIALIVIIAIVVLIVVLLLLNKNEYKTIEKEMKKAAQDYISSHKITVENQEFLTLSDLKISEGAELCSKASGVVVTNVSGKIEYKPYLKCLDYESDIITNSKKYIELIGPEVVLVNAGSMYFDEGYTQKKADVEIETVGEVLKEPGAYTINYVVKKNGKQKTVVKRIVIVSSVNTAITASGLNNKEQPIINLNGEKEIYLAQNTKYEEPGYTAYDYEDGKITRKVVVNGKVNSSIIGDYVINYSISNSKGINYSVKRTVHVVKEVAKLTVEVTTKEAGAATNESIINIRVIGEGFKKLILPDGTETLNNITSYAAKNNGTYTFKIVDIYDNIMIKSVDVENIDSKPPTGTCNVVVTANGSTFEVKANDESGIAYVNYNVNGNNTGFLQTTKYVTKEKVSTASVILKDVAGNTAAVTCKTGQAAADNAGIYTFKYNNDKPLIKCDSYTEEERKNLEQKLAAVVNKAGYGTRAGVVAAARFLVGGLDYRIPYLGPKNSSVDPDGCLGRYGKTGLNIANSKGWGCQVHGWTQGMDCTNFVNWAFVNGGLELKSVYSTSNTHKSAEVANQIQVGDLMLTPCGSSCPHSSPFSHVGIVIGINSTKIYVAEATTGSINSIVISEYDKNNMPTSGKFSVVRFYPYESNGNVTNMWN